MVSIPDWSKFSRLGEMPQQNLQPHSKYYKHREEEVIKQAEEHGYFLTPSAPFIIENFGFKKVLKDDEYLWDQERMDKSRELRKIPFVHLVGLHVRGLGELGMCMSLRMCILHSNYITRFDSLAACRQLMVLDLHSNQITSVPDMAFWSSMRHLKILYLHDNPIGHIENLHNMAAAPKLLFLTLHNTPISLKKNYRHHVVNTIWSLKALDQYVISDEEIIEDADFGGRFSVMHPAFRLQLPPFKYERTTFMDELTNMNRILSNINTIMARSSPVLIIQRMVRGLLTRKRYKIVQDTRIWAAVTIQRKYRNWKNIPPITNRSGVITARALQSPVFNQVPPSTADSASVKMDYDTYMKYRRPGSASELSTPRVHPGQRVTIAPIAKHDKPEKQEPTSAELSAEQAIHKKKNLYINLNKLQAGTLQSLQDESVAIEMVLPSEKSTIKESKTESEAKSKAQQKKKEKKRIRDVRQFFGPVVPIIADGDEVEEDKVSQDGDDESIPKIHFRLEGLKSKVTYIDPMAEMILSHREAGKNVRDADDDHHKRKMIAPKPVIKKKPTVNTDQRIFSRVQGTMGLSCLHAVQQAYKERERAEKNAAKMEYVLSMRRQREHAKDRIKIYKDEKRLTAMKKREQDHNRAVELIERQELKRINDLENRQEARNHTSQFSRQIRKEQMFVQDFGIQNTSVSNALIRHDRQSHLEDKHNSQTETIKVFKEMETEQQDMVKRYLEHRQLMRQTESAVSRAALDTKMLQDANERLLQAKSRVAQQKARKANVRAFYPLPSSSTHSLPPVVDKADEKLVGLDRWNTLIHAQSGHVGQHPTLATM